jgi:hypothetical protein
VAATTGLRKSCNPSAVEDATNRLSCAAKRQLLRSFTARCWERFRPCRGPIGVFGRRIDVALVGSTSHLADEMPILIPEHGARMENVKMLASFGCTRLISAF